MKKVFKKIGNFFKKIGLFIWKIIKVIYEYIKENAWLQPIVIVALIFAFVFGFQGIVNGIDKIKENRAEAKGTKHSYTKITMGEVRSKIDNKDDFVLFIGANDCYHCDNFRPVIDKYVSSTGNMIYYVDIHDSSDATIDSKTLLAWAELLEDIDTRDFDGTLSTPTVVVIRGGEFKDAKSGATGLSGGMEYLNFVKFVEGEYIGKIEPASSTQE